MSWIKECGDGKISERFCDVVINWRTQRFFWFWNIWCEDYVCERLSSAVSWGTWTSKRKSILKRKTNYLHDLPSFSYHWSLWCSSRLIRSVQDSLTEWPWFHCKTAIFPVEDKSPDPSFLQSGQVCDVTIDLSVGSCRDIGIWSAPWDTNLSLTDQKRASEREEGSRGSLEVRNDCVISLLTEVFPVHLSSKGKRAVLQWNHTIQWCSISLTSQNICLPWLTGEECTVPHSMRGCKCWICGESVCHSRIDVVWQIHDLTHFPRPNVTKHRTPRGTSNRYTTGRRVGKTSITVHPRAEHSSEKCNLEERDVTTSISHANLSIHWLTFTSSLTQQPSSASWQFREDLIGPVLCHKLHLLESRHRSCVMCFPRRNLF